MSILNWAIAGVAGYAIYKAATRSSADGGHAALAGGEHSRFDGNFAKVRNAGADAQRDKPQDWDKSDEASDQSFPASDPPANY